MKKVRTKGPAFSEILCKHETVLEEVRRMDNNGNGNKELFKRMVKAGRRTYFISARESKNSKKYITLTESKLVDKNKFDRSNILVFPEKMEELVEALQDACQVVA